MKKLKIYLDTSIISFLFAQDSPDFKEITEQFFEYHSNDYKLYISEIVLLEINKTSNSALKQDLLSILQKYPIEQLIYNEEIDSLAKAYILNKIIPESKIEDALHIGYSTFYEMDVLLSWNFKHLANIKKEFRIHIENLKLGYNYQLRLLSPLEVINEEQN